MLAHTLLLPAIIYLFLATSCNASPRYYNQYHIQPRVVVPQSHYEVLEMRASTPVNPGAVKDVKCIDRNARIVFHDQNVAELSICRGIAGPVTKCQGLPAETTGRSGTALFALRTAEAGAQINISKDRWEQCVRAARAVCPTGSMSGTCVGGATTGGDVAFTLTNP